MATRRGAVLRRSGRASAPLNPHAAPKPFTPPRNSLTAPLSRVSSPPAPIPPFRARWRLYGAHSHDSLPICEEPQVTVYVPATRNVSTARRTADGVPVAGSPALWGTSLSAAISARTTAVSRTRPRTPRTPPPAFPQVRDLFRKYAQVSGLANGTRASPQVRDLRGKYPQVRAVNTPSTTTPQAGRTVT